MECPEEGLWAVLGQRYHYSYEKYQYVTSEKEIQTHEK